jgi:hypothetical protein
MVLETIVLGQAIRLATPIAKRLFSSKLLPLLENKITGYFKNKTAIKRFERESIKYIARLTGQCSIMNTIAFQNSPKRLNDLYIPLTLISDNKELEIVVDSKVDIFQQDPHILINDIAGMGKSTISKKIILNVIDQDMYIPVFIELRQLVDKPIEHQISEYFGITNKSPIDIIKQLPLLYVFDGMDEVPNDIKKDVIKYLKDFVEQIGSSKVLITSRQESHLSEFYSFKRFSIKPLEAKEAFSLISKYDPIGDISKKLISGMNRVDSKGLTEFLTTPLYVSLLFCAYRHKTVIPKKKHLFYSQVYEALFESHDLSKEVGYVRPKYSKLDSAEFHTVLRRLGFWCLKTNGKIEFQKDELEIIVSNLLNKITGLDTNAPDFVKDLTTTVPLFVKDGATLCWSQKSLMEYFASMFICNDTKSQQQDVLLKLFNSTSWSSYTNIFELCSDIDYSSFRSSIVKQVLNDFRKYNDMAYKNISNKSIKKHEIEKRISLTFASDFAFEWTKQSYTQKDLWKEDEYKEAIKLSNKKKDYYPETRYLMSLDGQEMIHLDSKSGRNKQIMNIIGNKFSDLFIKIERDYEIFTKLSRTSSLKKKTCYIVNDDPKSKINNPTNFSFVNAILQVTYYLNIFDIDAVKKELASIDNDKSNGIDSLIDGI